MKLLQKQKIAVSIMIGLTIAISAFLILQRTPTEFEYRQNAQALAGQKKWDKLEMLAKQWAADYPASGMSYAARGDALRMQGDFSQSVGYYEKAVAIEKENPQLLALLGIMQLESGTFDKAIVSCTKSIRLLDRYPDALYCLALAYAETGESNETTKALLTLKATNPAQYELAKKVITTHTCAKLSVTLDHAICAR